MPEKIEDFRGRETDKIPKEFCGPENPSDFLGIAKQFSPALGNIKYNKFNNNFTLIETLQN